jgi:hypothetical protein
MTLGVDPLDPLELPLLTKEAESLSDLDREDLPLAEEGTEDDGQGDEEP